MTDTRRAQAFTAGLLGGAVLGTVAGVIFAPQILAVFQQARRDLTDRVSGAGDAATGAYRDAATRAIDAVDDLHDKGRGAYGKVLSVIARGAEDIGGKATDAQAKLEKTPRKSTTRRKTAT